jgi:PKD repeat protein
MRHLYLFCLLALSVILRSQTLNYYFGNIHAHTSYSDGNQDSASSHMSTPLQAFNYAKSSQHIDFYGISEHNHASAGLNNPANYHKGVADANTANNDGTFVAMYGMEWGVISGGGHVLVYGIDSLVGWDNQDYDIYVAQNDYAALWKKINERAGSFAYFAHPQTGDYDNLLANTVDLMADNAIVGTAARSGPAFSTNTSYSNPSTGNYIARYNDALKRGYHLGVGLDHDTHNSVFGRQTDGRLVVMAPSLTRANIMDAIQRMRIYSSDDWNLKVNFTIAGQPMGSIMTHTGTPTISATITDPDGESVSAIAVYYGVPGSGTNPTVLTTVNNTSNLSYTHNITNNSSYYYYLKITQSDGDIVWTSPIWYKRNDAVTSTPPVAAFSASSQTVCVGSPVTFTDNTANAPMNWNWTLSGALPGTSINQNVIASYTTAGTYTVSLNTSNTYGTSNTVSHTITVLPLPNLSVNSGSICTGESYTLAVSGANTYSWSTGATNASIVVTPTVSTLYKVTGFLNGCSSTVSPYVLVYPCVGIEELSGKTMKMYPNPAHQNITLELQEEGTEKSIEVYNETGQMVMVQQSKEAALNLDVSCLRSGIYTVKVVTGNTYTISKFVVRHW